MHACGHCGHMAILLCAAALIGSRKNKLPKDAAVRLLAQPAEEGPPVGEEGGAKLMLKEGIFDKTLREWPNVVSVKENYWVEKICDE